MNSFLKGILLLGWVLFSDALLAQSQIDEVLTDLLENMYEDFQDVEIDEYHVEQMRWLLEHPICINNSTKEILEQLPFLSGSQIENILYFLYEYGHMHTLFELKAVKGLDPHTLRYLLPFLTLEMHDNEIIDNKTRTPPRHYRPRNELILRTTSILEKENGFADKKSLGNGMAHLLKNKMTYRRFIWSSTFEKDIGEKYWINSHPEFASSVLQYTGDKIVRTLMVGDFKVQFGQGLSQASNQFGRKSSMVLNTRKFGETLRRSSSADGMPFKRGLGIVLREKRWKGTFFTSAKRVDATLYLDTIVHGTYFKALSHGGLHRTESEISKKNSILLSEAGANLSYIHNSFHLALHGTYLSHDQWMRRNNKDYKRWGNGGISGFGSIGGIQCWFEHAVDLDQNMATIVGLDAYPDKALGLSLVMRNYSKDYYSYGGYAFGEGSKPSNEQGIYFGLKLLPWNDLVLNTYVDVFRFPGPKGNSISPSSGWEGLAQLNGKLSELLEFTTRLKYEAKAQDKNAGTIHPTVQGEKWDGYLHLIYKIPPLVLKSRIQLTKLRDTQQHELGWLIYQDVQFSVWGDHIKATLRSAFFNTPSYSSRLYAYENDLLFAFSVPAYYGKGMRTYLNLSMQPYDKLTLYLKIGHTSFIDRSVIGTGFSGIGKEHKSEIKLQLRHLF